MVLRPFNTVVDLDCNKRIPYASRIKSQVKISPSLNYYLYRIITSFYSSDHLYVKYIQLVIDKHGNLLGQIRKLMRLKHTCSI